MNDSKEKPKPKVTGSLSVFSVADGDIEIKFDNTNPLEVIRAGRIIKDMLRRGYALMIKMADGRYTRALDFDEKEGAYVIADFDPTFGEAEEEQRFASAARVNKIDPDIELTLKETKKDEKETATKEKSKPGPKKGSRRTTKPIQNEHATAIARSAGG